MPAPTDDFLNQAIDEVVTVLKASPAFMASSAPSPPTGASGVIVYVDDDLPICEDIPKHRVPHCGVAYLGDDPNLANSASSDTAYTINIGLRLYNRGADRRRVWRELLKAGAAIAKIVAYEMGPDGSQFNGFAENARYIGGTPIDTREQGGFGALLPVRIALEISRPDY